MSDRDGLLSAQPLILHFDEILRAHQSSIRSFFRKITAGRNELADELAQETFLLVYKNLQQYRGEGSLKAWIYSIARRVYLNTKVPHEVSSEEEWIGTTSLESDSRLDLERCFRWIDDEERLVLCLSYVDGLSHQEVSDMMNLPLGTVKTKIARAKQKILEGLGKRQEVKP